MVLEIKINMLHGCASPPVNEALAETGSTGCRTPPPWHLLLVEIFHAFWLILGKKLHRCSLVDLCRPRYDVP